MSLILYDTYTRSLREFEPLSPGAVGLYACGPTVYDFPHIGNMRTYVFGDLLRRALVFNGYSVRQVMNITDVGHLVSDADTGEDKMEAGSRRAGKTAWEIAEYYTEVFKEDMRRLNILEPDTWCRATDHIAEQIQEIQCIEQKGFTYPDFRRGLLRYLEATPDTDILRCWTWRDWRPARGSKWPKSAT